MIIHAWSKGSRICDYANELNLSANSLGQHFIHLREVCSMQILSMDLRMGGPGVVIEIDESQFRHKPKHHRGRGPVSTVWVFGMVDTSTSPSIGIMKVVPDRSAATLLPIIYDNIRPGSIIHSDQWAAYTRLRSDPQYNYRSVNHSLHFVDPVTGVHTQSIESYWAKVKLPIKSMKGVHTEQLSSYLDERMWRDRFGGNAFENICIHIASQYPV